MQCEGRTGKARPAVLGSRRAASGGARHRQWQAARGGPNRGGRWEEEDEGIGEADMWPHSKGYNRLFTTKHLISKAGVMRLAEHVHQIYVFLKFVEWSCKNMELLLWNYFFGVGVLLQRWFFRGTESPRLSVTIFRSNLVLVRLFLLPLFLFTCRISFVLSQIYLTLTKFVKRNNNIYNIKFVSLNPPWSMCW